MTRQSTGLDYSSAGSGAIEADADVVVFLYRDEVYYPESAHRGIAESIIGKHRSGPTGTARAAFLHGQASFAKLAQV